MSDNLSQLLDRLVREGATAILKVDRERFVEGGDPWTIVISSPELGEPGYVRAEEVTLSACLSACLSVVLTRLKECGERWQWVAEYRPQ